MARYKTVSLTPEFYDELAQLAKSRAEELGLSELSLPKFIEILVNSYKENR